MLSSGNKMRDVLIPCRQYQIKEFAILSPSINMEKAYPAKIGDRKIKIIEKEMSNIVFILAMASILFYRNTLFA